MIYILKSNSKIVTKKILDKIISKNKIDSDYVFTFDFEENNSFNEAFNEYLSLSFNNEKKLILVKNANFIGELKIEKNLENQINLLTESTINNILILEVQKINRRGKIFKTHENSFSIIEKNSPTIKEFEMFIKDFANNNNLNLKNEAIKIILSKQINNFDLLYMELQKILLLSKNELITKEIVENVIIDHSRERLFKVSEYVMELNYDKTKKMFAQFKNEGEQIYLIGEFLVRGFSKLLRYKLLIKNGYDHKQILKITNWNPWEIKNFPIFIENWSSEDELKNFFYEIILKKSFLELINSQNNFNLFNINLMEKILLSNIFHQRLSLNKK